MSYYEHISALEKPSSVPGVSATHLHSCIFSPEAQSKINDFLEFAIVHSSGMKTGPGRHIQ